MSDKFKSIEEKTEPIPSILVILQDISSKVDDKETLQRLLKELEIKRQNWIKRISNNQKKLLANMPLEFTSITSLWNTTKKIIPDCNYKEFRFRLHELEWLGLADRYWNNDHNMWFYRRLEKNRN